MTMRNTSAITGLAATLIALQASMALAQTEVPSVAPAAPVETPAGETPPPPAPYTPPAATAPADGAVAPAPAPAAPQAESETPATTSPALDAAATATAPAAGAEAALAAVGTLPTGIEDVQVVGPWMDGDRSGVWRTIMMQVGTSERESYRFYIQQIERTGETQGVIATTEITEMPGIDGAIVGYRAEEPSEEDPSGLTLFFDIVPSDGEIAETYELHFFKDQPYTFGPATN